MYLTISLRNFFESENEWERREREDVCKIYIKLEQGVIMIERIKFTNAYESSRKTWCERRKRIWLVIAYPLVPARYALVTPQSRQWLQRYWICLKSRRRDELGGTARLLLFRSDAFSNWSEGERLRAMKQREWQRHQRGRSSVKRFGTAKEG